MCHFATLLLVAAFCGASAITLNDAVASLCPDIQEALGGLTILNTLVASVGETEIDIPEGGLVVAAPTDAAFLTLLDTLGSDAASLQSNTELVASVLSLHLGVTATTSDSTAVTLLGESMSFTVDDTLTGLEDFIAAVGDGESAAIKTETTTADVEAVVSCPGQTAFVISSVLIPAVGDEVAEAPAEAPESSLPAPITIGDVAAGLCPAIQGALVDFPTLVSLIETTSDVELELPGGATLEDIEDIPSSIVIAPTEEAFAKLFEVTGTDLPKDTIAAVLKVHVGGYSAEDPEFVPTLAGEDITFTVDGEPTTLAEFIAAVEAGSETAVVKTPASEATAAGVVQCEDQTAIVVDTVLLPADIAAAVAEEPEEEEAMAPAPMEEEEAEAPAPAQSGAAGKAFTVAAAVVAAAAMLA
jgi:uncharacterized surface protein with fasciclin (FAS1) repeats